MKKINKNQIKIAVVEASLLSFLVFFSPWVELSCWAVMNGMRSCCWDVIGLIWKGFALTTKAACVASSDVLTKEILGFRFIVGFDNWMNLD